MLGKLGGEMTGEKDNKMPDEEPPLQKTKDSLHDAGADRLPGRPECGLYAWCIPLGGVFCSSGCKPHLGLRHSPNLYFYDGVNVSGSRKG